MGSAFHQLCPRYSGALTLTATMANRLWETFTYVYTVTGQDHKCIPVLFYFSEMLIFLGCMNMRVFENEPSKMFSVWLGIYGS